MSERWWVISESAFRDALRAAADGADPDVVLIEQYANSDTESYEGGGA